MFNLKKWKLFNYWCSICHCSWSAEKLFEVRHFSQLGERFVVNIDEQSCTCRKWGISGIPYCHSLSAMKFLNLNGEDFIPVVFRKSTYKEIYISIIFPSMVRVYGRQLHTLMSYPPRREFYQVDRRKKED